MIPLKDWVNLPETKRLSDLPIKQILTYELCRDPGRAIYYNRNFFLSPADGFILYSKVVQPEEEIINVKGVKYTTSSLMREDVTHPCLVIGIFMTSLDVHINRIPTDGLITYQKLPPLHVNNLSMRETEKEITEKLGQIEYDHLNYCLYNERVRNRIFCNWAHFRQPYYLIQIADFEVDVIAHFDESQNRYYSQGERFSLVRMGSQVDVLIPLFPKTKVQSLVDDRVTWHVEAGIDPIVRIL